MPIADLWHVILTLVTGAAGYTASMYLHQWQKKYLESGSKIPPISKTKNTAAGKPPLNNDADLIAQRAERREHQSTTLLRMMDTISKEVELDNIVERVIEAAYTLVTADR